MAHCYNQNVEMPDLYSVVSKDFGFENSNMYEMDYKLMGKRIAELILDDEKEDDKKEDCFERHIIQEGHFPQRKAYFPRTEESLKFLTVRNSTSEAIKRLLPMFKEQSGIDVNIVETPYDELRKMVTKMKISEESAFDLVRIDMAWMMGTSEHIFREIDRSNEIIKQICSCIFPGISEEYYSVNGTMYALPLDACVQMLFCRKDMFEDELIKRRYYESSRKKLEIPRDFAEYNKIARFFTRRYNKKSSTETETYGKK